MVSLTAQAEMVATVDRGEKTRLEAMAVLVGAAVCSSAMAAQAATGEPEAQARTEAAQEQEAMAAQAEAAP